MPTIRQDVTLKHALQKNIEPADVPLSAGDPVSIIKEWESHYLIKTADGKVLNILKQYVDPTT